MFRVNGESGSDSVLILKPRVGDVVDVSSWEMYLRIVVLPALSKPLQYGQY